MDFKEYPRTLSIDQCQNGQTHMLVINGQFIGENIYKINGK